MEKNKNRYTESGFWDMETVWDYISKDGKILNRKKILQFLDKGELDSWDIKKIAGISQDGRELIKYWVKRNYEKLLKEKPDSFFAKIAKKDYEKSIQKGEDPFDFWYDRYKSDYSEEGANFLKLLTSLLRIFV